MYSTKQWSSSFIINIFKYSDYVHKNVVIVCYYFIIITQIKLSTLKMRQSGLFILKTSVCSYFRMDIGTLHKLGSVLSIPSKSKTLLSGNNLLCHQSICLFNFATKIKLGVKISQIYRKVGCLFSLM